MAYCMMPEYLGGDVRDDDEVEGGAGGVTEDAVEQVAQLFHILVVGAEDSTFVGQWQKLVIPFPDLLAASCLTPVTIIARGMKSSPWLVTWWLASSSLDTPWTLLAGAQGVICSRVTASSRNMAYWDGDGFCVRNDIY